MHHDAFKITDRLAVLANRIRKLALMRSWAVLIVMTGVTGFACLLLDYLVRWTTPVAPLLESGLIVVVFAIMFLKSVLPAMRRSLTPFEMAILIERKHRMFGQRLSSAILLCEAQDPDSRDFVEALMKQVEKDLTDEVISGMVDIPKIQRAVTFVSAFVFIMVVLPILKPQVVSIASQRLLAPWDAPSWPRRNELVPVGFAELEAVSRVVALGEDLTVTIQDSKGRMPKQVFVDVRRGWQTVESIEADIESNSGRVTFVNVREPFEFRLIGGDDPGEHWYAVSVEIPPKVERSAFKIRAPDYVGLPEISRDGNLRVLSGSDVVPAVQFSDSVHAARLGWESKNNSGEILLSVDADPSTDSGYAGTTLWHIEESGDYWIEYSSTSGAKTRTRPARSVSAYVDQPPQIDIVWPGKELDICITGAAELNIALQDDVHVKSATLYFSVNADDEYVSLDIPVRDQPEWTNEQAAAIHAGSYQQVQTMDVLWDLSNIAGLYPGQRIAYYIVAEDLFGHKTESPLQYLRLVTSRQLIRTLQQKRVQLTEALRGIHVVQQEMITNAETVLNDFNDELPLNADQLGVLQSVELHQGDIKRACSMQTGSIRMAISQIVEQGELNRLSNAAERKRLSRLVQQLDYIHDEYLISLSQQLNDTVDVASSKKVTQLKQIRVHLGEVLGLQNEAEREFADALSSYRSQLSYQRFTLGIAEVRQVQEQVGADLTNYRAKSLIGNPVSADAIKTTARLQGDAAQKLTTIVEDMGQWLVGDFVTKKDARVVTDMLQVHNQRAIAERMRQISRLMNEHLIEEALGQHENVTQFLLEMTNAQGVSTEVVRRETQLQLLSVSAEELHAIYRDLTSLHQDTLSWDGAAEDVQKGLVIRQQALTDSVRNIMDRELGQASVEHSMSSLSQILNSALQSLMIPNRLAATKSQQAALQLIENIVHVITQSVAHKSHLESLADDSNTGSAAKQSDGLMLAEIRLLIKLQTDINQQVDEIYSDNTAEELTVQQRETLERLASEQMRIAEIVAEIRNRDLQQRSQEGEVQ